MKLLAWNLNHKATERKLKEGVAQVIHKLSPDVLVLTEYVHGDSRAPLVAALEQMGMQSILLSDRINLNNQVLIASRFPWSVATCVALIHRIMAAPATFSTCACPAATSK